MKMKTMQSEEFDGRKQMIGCGHSKGERPKGPEKGEDGGLSDKSSLVIIADSDCCH